MQRAHVLLAFLVCAGFSCNMLVGLDELTFGASSGVGAAQTSQSSAGGAAGAPTGGAGGMGTAGAAGSSWGGAGGDGPLQALWSKRFGAADAQYVRALAVDGSGNVILTGELYGGADFGGGPLNSAGSSDVFVAKLDGGGQHVWSVVFGDAAYQGGNDVAVDAAGNVFVVGNFEGTLSTGVATHQNVGATDVFVLALDAMGQPVWSFAAGDAAAQQGNGIAVDAVGGVFVAGSFAGSAIFGATMLTATVEAAPPMTPSTDVFLAKLGSTGTPIWAKQFGGDESDIAWDVVSDGSDVIVCGEFAAFIDFGGLPFSDGGGSDAFIARFHADGMHDWSRAIRGSGVSDGNQEANGLALAPNDGLVVTGYFENEIEFEPGFFESPGLATMYKQELFVARLAAGTGQTVWGHGFFGLDDQVGLDVAVDSNEHAFVVGWANGTFDFGAGSQTSAGISDVSLIELDPLGNTVESLLFGDALDQDGNAVAVDPLGDVFLGAEFIGDIDFGLGPLHSAGFEDIALAKLRP
jgi:hypothetical protein